MIDNIIKVITIEPEPEESKREVPDTIQILDEGEPNPKHRSKSRQKPKSEQKSEAKAEQKPKAEAKSEPKSAPKAETPAFLPLPAEPPLALNQPAPPVEVVDVRFKVGGKIYYFAPGDLKLQSGQNVIIETARGMEYGLCTQGNHMVSSERVVPPLRPVVRIATEQDDELLITNRQKEAKAFEVCQQKIIDLNLDMKLIDVEYSFDGSKILFFFTSDGRVDFRELVKGLASIFRTRIELRQIGVRDEAKMLGGLGICGRPFCCSQFLDDFHPVSIKMAKTQNLSLNPTKISGTCGRLMCCLKYEQYAYEDMVKRTPKLESYVETPLGKGVVTEISLLKATVKVTLDNEPETPHLYKTNEIIVLHNGSRNKKSAPLLPPDPPVEMEEEEIVAPDYPQIIYSSQDEDVPETEDKAEGQRSRNRRNRSKNKKKPAADQAKAEKTAQEQPAQKAADQAQKTTKNQKSTKRTDKKPWTKTDAKTDAKTDTKTDTKAEPKSEAKTDAKTETKPKTNKNRYYKNRRKKPADGGAKQS